MVPKMLETLILGKKRDVGKHGSGSQDQTVDHNHDFLTRFSSGTAPLTPELIDEFLKVLPKLTCKVKTTLNWASLDSVDSFKLVVDPSKAIDGKCYAMSSEHLAVFAKMIISHSAGGITSIPVIVKYHLLRKTDTAALVQNMSQDHCQGIIRNYNILAEALAALHKENRFMNVNIVGVCIATSAKLGLMWNTNGANLWIEQYIDDFKKLWHIMPADNGRTVVENHLRMVATTDHRPLVKLQEVLYNEFFDKKFTLADIQGGVMLRKNLPTAVVASNHAQQQQQNAPLNTGDAKDAAAGAAVVGLDAAAMDARKRSGSRGSHNKTTDSRTRAGSNVSNGGGGQGNEVVIEYPWLTPEQQADQIQLQIRGEQHDRIGTPPGGTHSNRNSGSGQQLAVDPDSKTLDGKPWEYILCDIEYTDTLRAKFNRPDLPYHKSADILSTAKENWENWDKNEAQEIKRRAVERRKAKYGIFRFIMCCC